MKILSIMLLRLVEGRTVLSWCRADIKALVIFM